MDPAAVSARAAPEEDRRRPPVRRRRLRVLAATALVGISAVVGSLDGMVDAAVSAWLQDEGFDLEAAKRLMTRYVEAAI